MNRDRFDLEQCEEAAALLEHATEPNQQDDRAFMYQAAACGYINRIEDANRS